MNVSTYERIKKWIHDLWILKIEFCTQNNDAVTLEAA